MKYLSKKTWKLALFAATAVALGACGANHGTYPNNLFQPLNQPSQPIGYGPITVSCVSGQIAVRNHCYTDLATGCAAEMGVMRGSLCELDSMATSAGVVPVLPEDKGSFSMTDTWNNLAMPRLNPGTPSITNALSSGIQVAPGDKIKFVGDGKWGSFGTTWGVIPTCNNFANQDGVRISDGSMLDPVDGQPEGLMIGNGVETFFVAGSATVQFNSVGMVALGFNAPYDHANSCSDLTIHEFRLIHCENSAGVTYPCP